MGAGQVGYHLARSLSRQKHDVSVIEAYSIAALFTRAYWRP